MSSCSDTLRRETLEFTARKDYSLAEESFKQIEMVKLREKEHRLMVEARRQVEERRNLERAFKIEKARVCAEWARRLEEVEEECKRQQEILEEKQLIARIDLQKDVASRAAKMRFKKSPTLLQLEDTESKLARERDFRQAMEVMSRAERQRKLEEAEFQRRRSSQGAPCRVRGEGGLTPCRA